MSDDRIIGTRFAREVAKREAFVREPDDAATTEQKLVHAAETGRYGALVAAAQPAEPPKMVTPEEHEAELRRTGQWPEEPKTAPTPEPKEPEPPAIEPGQPTEPTPGMTWAEEHLGKRPRGPAPRRRTHNPYRCLTEYDVITGEIIGDGYDHRFDGDGE
jgi:hypothetical protein